MLERCGDLLLHEVFKAPLIRVDDERTVSEVGMPCLNCVHYCHQFFFIDEEVLMSWSEGTADEAYRVFSLHKDSTDACV